MKGRHHWGKKIVRVGWEEQSGLDKLIRKRPKFRNREWPSNLIVCKEESGFYKGYERVFTGGEPRKLTCRKAVPNLLVIREMH